MKTESTVRFHPGQKVRALGVYAEAGILLLKDSRQVMFQPGETFPETYSKGASWILVKSSTPVTV